MTDFAKRIQSRLARRSVTVTKQDILKRIDEFSYDSTNMNEDEMSNVVESYIGSQNNLVTKLNSENQLTISEKQTLTRIQANSMGLQLTDLQICEIADMADNQINDVAGFLDVVSQYLRDFLTSRNKAVQDQVTSKIQNIETIINTANDGLADIFNGANTQLNNIVTECRQQATDYKSPYASRLESIRESLEVRKQSFSSKLA
jgi:hypothetical protein